MKSNNQFPIRLRTLALTLAFVAAATALRFWPLDELGDRFIWSTFYPAVVLAAIFGSFYCGIIATILSSLVAYAGWHYFSGHSFLQDNAGWLGIFVFLFNGILISIVAGKLKTANAKTQKTKKQLEEKVAQLNAMSDNLPDSFIFQTITNDLGLPEFVYVSDGVRKFTGKSGAEVVKNQGLLYDLILEEDRDQYLKARNEAAQQIIPLNMDLRFSSPAVPYQWANIHVTPRRRDDGSFIWDGIFTDITKRKQLEKELVEQKTFAQQLITESTIEEQENERRHISHHLNEDINQILASVKIHLEMARKNDEKKEELLNTSYEELKLAIQKIKRLYNQIDAPSFSDLGFYQTLELLMDKSAISYGLEISFINQMDERTELPGRIMLFLYRVIQEQLENIVQHAGTKKATVKLAAGGHGLELIISDNGKGFDAGAGNWGMGFKKMQGRIAFYGGNMQILSAPGKGCTLLLTLPVEKAFNESFADQPLFQ